MSAKRTPVVSITAGMWVEVPASEGWAWKKLEEKVKVYKFEEVYCLRFEDESELNAMGDQIFVTSESDPTSIPPRPAVPDWDEYFLLIAESVATRAKCRRRQVGAVIVDSRHRIVSTGYNGHPESASDVPKGARTLPDCLEGGCPRGLLSTSEIPAYSSYDSGLGTCIASHAEVNATSYRSQDVRGTTIYVTDKPCFSCTRSLLGNGVVRAVWPEGESLVRDLFQEYLQKALEKSKESEN